MPRELTQEDLGELIPCENCGKLTFSRKIYDKFPDAAIFFLPKGFNRSHARHFISMQNRTFTVCEQCRYEVFGRY